jgi:putative ABC transport system substrate-binding protein
VPIVAVDLETDPVAAGFVASLARPGGNVTGFFLDLTEFSGKLLQLVKEAVPAASRVAPLHDPVIGHRQLQVTETAARSVDITVHAAPIRKAADVETAIVGGAGGRPSPDRAVGTADAGQPGPHRPSRAPAPAASITVFALLPDGVGFMSYGPDLDDMYRRSGVYAARISGAASASDLLIARPSRFEFAVNARTARTLGLTVSPGLLLRADRVIE